MEFPLLYWHNDTINMLRKSAEGDVLNRSFTKIDCCISCLWVICHIYWRQYFILAFKCPIHYLPMEVADKHIVEYYFLYFAAGLKIKDGCQSTSCLLNSIYISFTYIHWLFTILIAPPLDQWHCDTRNKIWWKIKKIFRNILSSKLVVLFCVFKSLLCRLLKAVFSFLLSSAAWLCAS